MRSRRPYLLRAMIEWMTDNGWTPHLIVDGHQAGVLGVPPDCVVDGRLTLAVGPEACPDFTIEDDVARGSMRFGGVPSTVMIPMTAVLAIFAAETMEGLVFPEEGNDGHVEQNPGGDPGGRPPVGGAPGIGGRPRLRLVK